MADVIGAQLHQKAQELHEAVLALGIVIKLYMESSNKNIDDMIFIVDYLYLPIVRQSDELQVLLREAFK